MQLTTCPQPGRAVGTPAHVSLQAGVPVGSQVGVYIGDGGAEWRPSVGEWDGCAALVVGAGWVLNAIDDLPAAGPGRRDARTRVAAGRCSRRLAGRGEYGGWGWRAHWRRRTRGGDAGA